MNGAGKEVDAESVSKELESYLTLSSFSSASNSSIVGSDPFGCVSKLEYRRSNASVKHV